MFVSEKLNNEQFPRDRLELHNADLKFVFDHLNSCRGPTHSNYEFNVLNTYRFCNLPNNQNFRKGVSKYRFLMHGVTREVVAETLRFGFDHKSSKKGVFGANYYFTSCSTKAANYSLPRAWNYELHADAGKIQPKAGDTGYIIYCIVATGTSVWYETRLKHSDTLFQSCDSLIFPGLHEPAQEEIIKYNDIEATLMRGPFRDVYGLSEKHPNDSMFYDEICVDTADKVFPLILAEVRYD